MESMKRLIYILLVAMVMVASGCASHGITGYGRDVSIDPKTYQGEGITKIVTFRVVTLVENTPYMEVVVGREGGIAGNWKTLAKNIGSQEQMEGLCYFHNADNLRVVFECAYPLKEGETLDNARIMYFERSGRFAYRPDGEMILMEQEVEKKNKEGEVEKDKDGEVIMVKELRPADMGAFNSIAGGKYQDMVFQKGMNIKELNSFWSSIILEDVGKKTSDDFTAITEYTPDEYRIYLEEFFKHAYEGSGENGSKVLSSLSENDFTRVASKINGGNAGEKLIRNLKASPILVTPIGAAATLFNMIIGASTDMMGGTCATCVVPREELTGNVLLIFLSAKRSLTIKEAEIRRLKEENKWLRQSLEQRPRNLSLR